jgi:hypothetical protein
MSQTNSHRAFASPTRTHSPVKDLSSPQLRAVRKELLLLRAEVERTEFMQARVELHRSMTSFRWLKLLMPGFRGFPGFGGTRAKGSGKGLNSSITEWLINHPLTSSLASLVLARPLRATLAAGAKPLVKWGSLGVAAWAAYRLVAQIARKDGDATRTRESEGAATP